MRKELGLVSQSRLRVFRRCKREHHLRYDLHWQPVARSEAIRFGSLFHHGLEAWWLAVKAGLPERLDHALAILRLRAAAPGSNVDDFLLVKAEELISGYDARWGADADKCEVLGVESEFDASMVNPDTNAPSRTYRVGGKLDALVRIDALKWLMEHKTTTLDISPGSDYWKRLQIDGQISMYFDGAAALGHDVAGCIYDVAVRPGQKPLKATPDEKRKYTKGKGCKECGGSAGGKAGVVRGKGEIGVADMIPCPDCDGTGWKEAPRLQANQREADETVDAFRERVRAAIAAEPGKFFVRGEVPRLEEEMDEHRRDVWWTSKHMREVELSGCAVRNPDACVQITHVCDFFGVCTGTASLDDPTLFTRSASAHPELSTPSQTKEVSNGKQQFEFNEF